MSAIEQQIISLFNELSFPIKAKIIAALSQSLAKEAEASDLDFLPDDLETSKQIRQKISEGKMDLLSEEEYWTQLKSS